MMRIYEYRFWYYFVGLKLWHAYKEIKTKIIKKYIQNRDPLNNLDIFLPEEYFVRKS